MEIILKHYQSHRKQLYCLPNKLPMLFIHIKFIEDTFYQDYKKTIFSAKSLAFNEIIEIDLMYITLWN